MDQQDGILASQDGIVPEPSNMHKELRTTSQFEPPSSTIGLQIRPVWTKSRRFVFEVDRSCRLVLYKLVVPTGLDRKPSSESVTVEGSDDQYRTVQMRLLPSCRLLSYTRALTPRWGREDGTYLRS